MSIDPIQLARVSTLSRSNLATQQIDQTQQQLQETQLELSTGKRLNVPSDDPGDSSVVMTLQKSMDKQNAYLTNVQQAQSQLGEMDSTLGDLNSLITQTQTIASQNGGSEVSADQRAAAAAVVQTLYTQAVSIGNKEFEGSYLFGGDKSTTAPFLSTNGGVQFVGSTSLLQNTIDQNSSLAFQVSGADVFGALSSRVTGTADLTPALTATTRVSDLRGATGAGVHLGTIQIGNGTTTKSVDLSQADTMQDVVNSINAAAVGNITASIGGNHLVLSTSGSDNITITDPAGATTAADLGIRQTTGGGAGASVVGASVQPNVTLLTPLSALKGGAGIDTTHGLIITNGQSSATVNLASANTVEGLLNAINSSGTGVRAQIDPSGTGIDILNPIQGTQMTIAENGGTTAADLGVRSFSPSSALTELNGGHGVQAVNPGPDFQITRSDGSNFSVSLNGALTVQDVISRINTASGGVGLTAGFATTGNGIVLTDSAGGAGKPTVTSLNFSAAAADLGLTTAAVGNTITGTDANPVEAPGLFANLAKLRDALTSSNQAAITAAAGGLGADQQRVVTMRGQTGAQEQELQSRQSSIQDQNVSTQALISQLQDADMPATIAKFATLQTALQATLQVSARTLQLSLMDFLQ
jgi:flagellar hook-associated protein 3 FlgL